MNGQSESPIKKFLVEYNSIFVLVISILIGSLLTFLAYDLLQRLEIIFLLPILVFLVMHYLKLKGIKRRLLAGLIIFLAVGVVSAGITSATYYQQDHPVTYTLYNGAQATLVVSPFGGSGPNYNFSMYVTNWPSSTSFSTTLNVSASAVSYTTYNFSQLNTVMMSNGSILVYKNINNLQEGIYSYSFVIANGSSPILVGSTGPVNSASSSLFAFILPGFVILYLIPMEVILLAIVFLARSFERTRDFRRPPPPKKEGQDNP